MSCLVIKNDGIGDLILFSGLLNSIASEFDWNVDLVTRKENVEIANLIPGVRNVFWAERDQVSEETLGALRKQPKYELAIVPRRFIRKSVFSIMQNISAKNKFCCWQYPTNLTSEEAKISSKGWKRFQGPHSSISELNYLHGFCQTALNCGLNPKPHLNFSKFSNLKQASIAKKRIGICLGGASSKWPYLHWFELLKGLVSAGFTPVLFGSKTDSLVADKLVSKINPVESFVGKLNLTETMQMFSQLECVVSNDTGLAHLATLCTPKVIIILGGGTFGRFFPWPQQKNQFIIHHGLNCYDCEWRCHLPGKACLDFIEPNEVLNYAKQVLSGDSVPQILDLNPKPQNYPIAWRLAENSCPEFSTRQEQSQRENSNVIFNENPPHTETQKPYRLVIFGTGPTAKNYIKTSKDKFEFIAALDNEVERRKLSFFDKPVLAPEEIRKLNYDKIFLASGHSIEMYHQLRTLGISSNKIIFPSSHFLKTK